MSILAEKPSKEIVLDGKTYKMKPLTLNIMEQIEDKFNLSWDEIVKSLRIKTIKYLLFLCLSPNHPELTEESIGEMITAESLLDAYTKALK